ncbi:MAG: hypothetical protein D6780_06830, partial [Candidatus Dadabacteria bacterium]
VIYCKVTVEYDTVLPNLFNDSASRESIGKSLFYQQLKGEDLLQSPSGSPSKVFFVALSPYVEIDQNNSKFFFPNGLFDDYNPLKKAGDAFTEKRKKERYQKYSKKFEESKKLKAMEAPEYKREKLALSKYNLYTAARNAVLTSFFERVVRFGETRYNLDLLVLSPMHQTNLYSPNPPIIIKGAGEDSLKRSYYYPLISWDHTNGNNSLGDPKNYICPYDDHQCDESKLHMLIASQLRDIFELHSASQPIITFGDPNIDINEFEPSEVESGASFNLATDDTWWPKKEIIDDRQKEELISVTEFIRGLGTVESCPVDQLEGCSKESVVNNPLLKPQGLQGDVTAFLRYVRGLVGAYKEQERHIPDPDGTLPPSFNLGNADLGPIVIVMSKRLNPSGSSVSGTSCQSSVSTPSSQMQDIRNEINNLQLVNADVPVYVFYFPTTEADVSMQAICDLKWAFKDGVGGNKVVTVGPSEDFCANGNPPPANFDDCLKEYWASILLAEYAKDAPFSYENDIDRGESVAPTASELGKALWNLVTETNLGL